MIVLCCCHIFFTHQWNLKLHSHMCGAVAERRRADFDIPAPLPRVCSHICGADAGGSAISWGQWWFGARGFEAGAVNWVLDPFVAERFLLPLHLRSATAHVWTHVMICVEANFPPAPAGACVNVPLGANTRRKSVHCKVRFTRIFWPNSVQFFCLHSTYVVVGVFRFL